MRPHPTFLILDNKIAAPGGAAGGGGLHLVELQRPEQVNVGLGFAAHFHGDLIHDVGFGVVVRKLNALDVCDFGRMHRHAGSVDGSELAERYCGCHGSKSFLLATASLYYLIISYYQIRVNTFTKSYRM